MNLQKISSNLSGILNEKLVNDKAREVGFIKRQRCLDAWSFLLGLLDNSLGNSVNSLEGIVDSTSIKISKQALHQKFTDSTVSFLEKIAQSVLFNRFKSANDSSNIISLFGDVKVFDCCAWNVRENLKSVFPGSGGSGSASTIKLFLGYSLKTYSLSSYDITSFKQSDTSFNPAISLSSRAGDLVMMDLGFFEYQMFEELDLDGIYYISRIKPRTLTSSGMKISGFLRAARLKKFCRFETSIHLGQNSEKVRLVANLLPEKVINQRIRRATKVVGKKNKTLSRERKEMLRWSLVITNIPTEMLSADSVINTYKLRWSIELLFKQMKSTLNIHVSNHSNANRLRCEILAKVIITALFLRIINFAQRSSVKSNVEISLEKAFKLIKKNRTLFIQSVKDRDKWIKELVEKVSYSAKKEAYKSRKTSLGIIKETLLNPIKYQVINIESVLN